MHTTTGVKGRISNVGGNLQIIGVQFFLFFLCICVRILLRVQERPRMVAREN